MRPGFHFSLNFGIGTDPYPTPLSSPIGFTCAYLSTLWPLPPALRLASPPLPAFALPHIAPASKRRRSNRALERDRHCGDLVLQRVSLLATSRREIGCRERRRWEIGGEQINGRDWWDLFLQRWDGKRRCARERRGLRIGFGFCFVILFYFIWGQLVIGLGWVLFCIQNPRPDPIRLLHNPTTRGGFGSGSFGFGLAGFDLQPYFWFWIIIWAIFFANLVLHYYYLRYYYC